jgi:hypothetical protein
MFQDQLEQTVGPEMSAPNHTKTPGNYPKEDKLYPGTSYSTRDMRFSL